MNPCRSITTICNSTYQQLANNFIYFFHFFWNDCVLLWIWLAQSLSLVISWFLFCGCSWAALVSFPASVLGKTQWMRVAGSCGHHDSHNPAPDLSNPGPMMVPHGAVLLQGPEQRESRRLGRHLVQDAAIPRRGVWTGPSSISFSFLPLHMTQFRCRQSRDSLMIFCFAYLMSVGQVRLRIRCRCNTETRKCKALFLVHECHLLYEISCLYAYRHGNRKDLQVDNLSNENAVTAFWSKSH